MPELPEVETIARGLRPELVGRKILRADVRWARTIAAPSSREFASTIQGQAIEDVGRRGKFVHMQLTSSHLLLHLRMSGDLLIKQGKAKPEKHDRLIVELGNGVSRSGAARGVASLVFNDTRKFGRVWLTDDPSHVTGSLGPEPLGPEFTAAWLYCQLRARRRLLKPLLLDQSFLAGIGNIYADEALHTARLHPMRISRTISRPQAERLHKAIRGVLKEGIKRNGASIDWVYRGGDFQNHFRVYDQAGKPCPACGTKIRRIVVGQRGTHICPRCQRI